MAILALTQVADAPAQTPLWLVEAAVFTLLSMAAMVI